MNCSYNKNILKEVLVKKNISIKALATVLELTERQVYNYLSGKSRPSVNRALIISKLTELPIEIILSVKKS